MKLSYLILAFLVLTNFCYADERKSTATSIKNIAADFTKLQQEINLAVQQGEENVDVNQEVKTKAALKSIDRNQEVKTAAELKAIDRIERGIDEITPPIEKTRSAKKNNLSDLVYNKIFELVARLKNKYETDPNINVSGFSINIDVPPSVTVSFEFKKPPSTNN